MSLAIGELFMLGFRGPTVPRWLENFAAEFGLGGVILFDYDCLDKRYERNISNPAQVKELCATIHKLPSRPRIYLDQEGGKVRRLKEKNGFAPLVSAKHFSRMSAAEQTAQLKTAYSQMHMLGIDCNLAPVVDLDINHANPDLGAVERCYSANPDLVMTCVRSVHSAARNTGVDLCLKHFPGCGAATVNAHHDLMDLSNVITDKQIDMFKHLLPLIPTVLFSHGMVTQWDREMPTSLSAAAVNMVRGWNPETVLITDDLQMEGMQKRMSTGKACTLAVRAGMDLLCIGNNMRDEQEACADFARQLIAACETEAPLKANALASIERLKHRKPL